MEQVITVKKIYQRDKGPWGVLDDATEEWFKIWSNDAEGMVEGGTYNVTYKEEAYKGKVSKAIVNWKPLDGSSPKGAADPVDSGKQEEMSLALERKHEDIAIQAMFKVVAPAFFSHDMPQEEVGELTYQLLVDLRYAWRQHKTSQQATGPLEVPPAPDQ